MRTHADDKLEEAKSEMEAAYSKLYDIVRNRLDGADEFTDEAKADMQESMLKLLDAILVLPT